jgi:hypothetical protein
MRARALGDIDGKRDCPDFAAFVFDKTASAPFGDGSTICECEIFS